MDFPGGVWPVMLTPYNDAGNVDYEALKELVDWYIQNGVEGLFAVCQSSEMFFLDLEERTKVARSVVEATGGRVPVIASGHVSDGVEEQIYELNEMAKTGIDALILITNRLAKEDESDDVWQQNLNRILNAIPETIPLGFYECPYPYKRLLSLEQMKACAETGRFYFMKDTCCDLELIKKRLKVLKGTRLKLYNANTTTLLDSLIQGAAGYSGVMANFHPRLYRYLCEHAIDDEEGTAFLQEFLTLASLVERQCYPVNAKYYLQEFKRLNMTTISRNQDHELLTMTFKKEIEALDSLTRRYENRYIYTDKRERQDSSI